MSDIPIGSPPAPPGRHAAPGGWYPDPVDGGQERYWDGWQWTRSTRPRAASGGEQPGWPPPERQPEGQPGGQVPGTPGGAGGPPAYGQGPAQPGPYPPGAYQPGRAQPGPYPSGPQPFPPGGYQPGPYGDPAAGHPNPYGAPQGGYPAYPGYGAPAYATGPATADGVPLAGWWWRFLAVLIDGVLLGLLTLLPTLPFVTQIADYFSEVLRQVIQSEGTYVPDTDFIGLTGAETVAYTLITLGVAAAYHVGFLRWKGATPGKLALGLRVVPLDQGRHPGGLPLHAAGVRTAVWILPGLSGLHPLLGFLTLFRIVDGLFPLFQPRKQAVHDLAARTQVVKVR